MRESYSNSFKHIDTIGDNLIYSATNDDLVHSLFLCNVTNLVQKVSIKVQSSDIQAFLIKNFTLPPNTTYSIERTVNLKIFDQLYVSCNELNSIDASVGILHLVPIYNELYKNAIYNLTPEPKVIYTCPNNKTANIHSIYICNLSSDNSSRVDLKIDDFYLLKNTEILPALNITWNKSINLQAGQSIIGNINGNIGSDIFLSILELSN